MEELIRLETKRLAGDGEYFMLSDWIMTFRLSIVNILWFL